MIITVTLQLRGGFQPVKVPTKPFDGVKLADDGQPSLVSATFRAGGNKRCRLPASSCGREGWEWCRLALRVVIQCPTLVNRPMSNEGGVRAFAEGRGLSPSVLQGVLDTRSRRSSLISRRLLAQLHLKRCRLFSLWRPGDRRSGRGRIAKLCATHTFCNGI